MKKTLKMLSALSVAATVLLTGGAQAFAGQSSSWEEEGFWSESWSDSSGSSSDGAEAWAEAWAEGDDASAEAWAESWAEGDGSAAEAEAWAGSGEDLGQVFDGGELVWPDESAAAAAAQPSSETELLVLPEETETQAAQTETEISADTVFETELQTEAQTDILVVDPAAGPGLPAVGDVVSGFEVKEIRPFPAIGAQIVLFEHQATHARLMYIANDDTNRVFDLTFLTDAIDKTGLPHVFEHSVLDGSEKYPSRTLWFNMAYQTYNTYMNAFTQSRLTSYPVASLSEEQLLNYADYYTQACLHPLVVKDESIFREEAWRYRLENADDPLTIEGTVYSEMLGAYDLSNAAYVNAMTAAFPGSMIGNEYGGDPAYIPDMTFEALQNYHALYYHPSNSIAYLYGNFADYTKFLALLDEAYAPYTYTEFVHADPDYVPLAEKTEASLPFPVEAGSDTRSASTAYYIIPCPGTGAEDELILNTLTDLLTDNASVLQQSLQSAIPGGSFSSFTSPDGPDDAIVFVAENIDEQDAGLFRDTVDEALAQIAQDGFPQDQVDGVMASLRITMLLMREDSDVGVNSIIPNLAYSYACSGEPFDFLDYVEGMAQMDDWNRQGLYAKAVQDWLLDAPASALVTTYPEPGLKEQQDAELAQKLASIKETMSEEEIAALVQAAGEEDPQEDNAETVAAMQAVTVDSLPEELQEYEVRDVTGEDGIRRIDVPAQVDGVGSAAIFLDAAGIVQDDLHWLQLFADLAGKLDTRAHTKAEVASLMGRYLNNSSIYVSVPKEGDSYHPYLRLTWTALDEDLEAGYDLMHEIVFEQNLDDGQKILETVKSLKADLKTSITQAPYNVQLIRAYAVRSELYRYYNYVKELDYYAFLEETESLLESDPGQASARLKAVAEQMNSRAGAVSIYCGSEAGIALNRPLADDFLANLGEAAAVRAQYDLPVPAASEALIIDSGVQFNGEMADYASLGLEGYDAGLDAVTALVSDAVLYPMLRDKYGAYSVFHGADEDPDEGVYVVSYRDPNIDKTFAVYEQLSSLVAGVDPDQAMLDGYILSAYAGYAKPQGELSGALGAAIDALEGRDPARRLEYMRELKAVTPETVEKYAQMYDALYAGVHFTAGPASAINAEADRYEAVLNPFGAVDYAQQGFDDVTEEAESYQAIMNMLEQGLMRPVSDTAFGTEEAATQGDLAAALYVLIGGEGPDAAEAVKTFAEFGYGDLEEEAPLTGADADGMLTWLSGGIWQGGSAEETLTRGDLAVLLEEFTAALEASETEADEAA